MRKALPVLALLAVATLPGCILAIGGKDDVSTSRVSALEKRVAALERHCQGECTDGCKLCDDAKD